MAAAAVEALRPPEIAKDRQLTPEEREEAEAAKYPQVERLSPEKEKELQKLKEAVDALNSKIQTTSDENLEKENKMGKELALSNQKVQSS